MILDNKVIRITIMDLLRYSDSNQKATETSHEVLIFSNELKSALDVSNT